MSAPLSAGPLGPADVVVSFGKHKGKTLAALLDAPDGRGYLTWLAGMRDFFDPYWPEAAAKALAGEPLPVRETKVAKVAKPATTPARSATHTTAVTSIPAVLGRPAVTVVGHGYLGITFPRNEALQRAFKAGVDGRWWNPTEHRWEAPIVQIRRIVEVLGGPEAVVLDDEAYSAYHAEVERRKQLDQLRKSLTGALEVPGLITPLWGYQRVAVEFAKVAEFRCIFAHDVGLGKTPMGIAVGLYTRAKTLVICPAAVKIGWARKIKKFAGLDSTTWEGDRVRGDRTNQFHIVGYEIFAKRKAELQAEGFDLVIVDECHNFANPKSLRSLALFGGSEKRKDKETGKQYRVKHARFQSKYCVMLTATAINNHPRELFPLLNYLAPDRFPNFYEYGMRYGAFPPGNLSGLPSKPMNLSDLHLRIGDIVLRVLEDEVQNDRPKALPPHDLWVELSAKQRREYNALLKALLGEWEDAKPTLASMHVLREWLNQVKLDRVWELIDSLQNAGKSVVLFSTRLEPLRETMDRYGDNAVLITGDMTLKARQRSIDAFSEQHAKVACISLRAGGTGIDGLQFGGHHVVFLDQDWVPALHHQAKGRLDRTGQPYAVVTYFAMVENTVDEYLREILDRKLAVSSEIMDGKAVKQRRRKSVFKEFVLRLKQDYAAINAAAVDEDEGSADEHLEAA